MGPPASESIRRQISESVHLFAHQPTKEPISNPISESTYPPFNRSNLCTDDGFAEVGHEADQRRVPLVRDLRESGATRGHQHLPDAVFERPDGSVVHPQKRLVRIFKNSKTNKTNKK